MCYCTLLRQVQAASLALRQTDTDEFDSMPLAALTNSGYCRSKLNMNKIRC